MLFLPGENLRKDGRILLLFGFLNRISCQVYIRNEILNKNLKIDIKYK